MTVSPYLKLDLRSLEEALVAQGYRVCPTCNFQGSVEGAKGQPEKCPRCGGEGIIK